MLWGKRKARRTAGPVRRSLRKGQPPGPQSRRAPLFASQTHASERGSRPTEASLLCEHHLVGCEPRCIFQTSPNVLRPELGVCRKNALIRLIGSKLFQNQIHRDSRPSEAGLPHHHVGSRLNQFRKLLRPNSIREPASRPFRRFTDDLLYLGWDSATGCGHILARHHLWPRFGRWRRHTTPASRTHPGPTAKPRTSRFTNLRAGRTPRVYRSKPT